MLFSYLTYASRRNYEAFSNNDSVQGEPVDLKVCEVAINLMFYMLNFPVCRVKF